VELRHFVNGQTYAGWCWRLAAFGVAVIVIIVAVQLLAVIV